MISLEEWYKLQDEQLAEGEAHIAQLINEGRCLRCESANTYDVTGEYDAVRVLRCEDCGYRYTDEM